MDSYAEKIQESDEELYAKQKASTKVVIFQRLQMLRLLKSGQAKSLTEAASLVGVSERSTSRWWKCYREQGLESLLKIAPTRKPRLSVEQQQALIQQAGKGEFSTLAEIAQWVEQNFGISYSTVGIWKLIKKLKIKKKTARPTHVQKDEKAAENFKKTSLSY